jgi:hypothetical protein
MAGLTEFYCQLNETSHASQFKWLDNTFNNSFNGSALRSFYAQKKILRIFYFHIISLIITVFKL